MSFVIAAPEHVQTAAQSLASIRSTLAEASASAAAPTTGVVVAARDEVSAGVAALFNGFGQEYQALNAQAQAFHAQFVNLMNAGAAAYLNTDVANAEQNLLNAVNAPAQSGGAAAGAGGGVVRALTAGLTTAQSAVFPLLGGGGTLGGPLLSGLGGGGTSVGSLLGGLGVGGTPVVPLLGGLGGGGLSVGPLLGGVGGFPSVSSLLGGLGGGSVGQGINGVVNALESRGVGSLLSSPLGTGLPGLQGLLGSAASTGAAGGPYQMLLQNTLGNLQTFTSAISANPNPFLNQFFKNLMGYGDTISSQLAYGIQNFPAVLAGLPASIQSGIQGLLAFNPSPYVQQIIINQMIYAELTYSSLQSAGGYFTAGLQALPPHLESALRFTLAGNYTAAQGELFQGVLGLLVAPPGAVVTSQTQSLTITTQHYSLINLDLPTSVVGNVGAGIVPVGTVGSLLPIFTIPGMEAQNFTNLLPGGSIAQQIAQHFTNVVKTVSDTSIGLTGLLDLGLNWGGGPLFLFPSNIPPLVTDASLGLGAHLGLPLALFIDAAGGPVNAWDGFNASTQAFNNAALSGHYVQAASALINAPANITNAFLNGHEVLPVSAVLDGVPITLDFPLDGILVGQTPATLTLDNVVTLPIGGTPISGLVPGLYYASQQLANAIAP